MDIDLKAIGYSTYKQKKGFKQTMLETICLLWAH